MIKVQRTLVVAHLMAETNIVLEPIAIRESAIEPLYSVFHLEYLRPNTIASSISLKRKSNVQQFACPSVTTE
jgi:hypothetical protein